MYTKSCKSDSFSIFDQHRNTNLFIYIDMEDNNTSS